MTPQPSLPLAYLVSQLPAINHTYLLREVRGLRQCGLDPLVASIRPPDRAPDALTPDERDEASRTFYVQSQSRLRVLGAHLRTLLSRPAGYLRGLFCPLAMGRGDAPTTFRLFLYFIEAVVVGDWMRRHRLAHVHVHFSSTVGLILARVFPVSVSFTFHGPAEFTDPAGFYMPEKIRAARFLCAISSYGRSQLMRLCPREDWDKIEVTPLGVDCSLFAPRPFRETPSPLELICVGRLAGEKAQAVLIAALDRLVREGRDLRLRLVGDGPDRPALEREVAARGLQSRVVFEGWLNQVRLRAVYERADIFVLPSFAEGLPVVLMEAMALEIPCVATRIAGVPELIQDGVDGILVPASDEVQLAGAIARLADSPPLRRQLGAAGRQRILRDYNSQVNVLRLARVFQARCAAPQESRSARR